MKILKSSKFTNLESAINLTPQCESPILKINEKTFVFYDEDTEEPYLVIESQIFGLLMKRLEGRVSDFNVFRPQCLCCEGCGDVTIRVTEIDGFIYQIDESEDIEICIKFEQVFNGLDEEN